MTPQTNTLGKYICDTTHVCEEYIWKISPSVLCGVGGTCGMCVVWVVSGVRVLCGLGGTCGTCGGTWRTKVE